MDRSNKFYLKLAAGVWSASILLCILSFWMGQQVVTAYEVAPASKEEIHYIEVKPLKPPVPLENLKKKQESCVISKTNKEMFDFIRSYNDEASDSLIKQIVNSINEESKRFQLPKEVLVGLVAAESSFDPKAISHKKCVGLTQINVDVWLSTLKDEGIIKNKGDLTSPEKNIKAGAHILRHYLDKAEQSGAAKPMKIALSNYNGTKKIHYYKRVMAKVEEFKNG